MNDALLVSNVALWLFAAALAAILAVAARGVRRLVTQLPASGALMIDRGPAIGERAPSFKVTDLAGRAIAIGEPTATQSMLLLFVSPSCPLCAKLLPLVAGLAKAEADWLRIVLVGDGDPGTEAARVRSLSLRDVPYVLSEAVGRAFRIGRLPYAVLIDDEGVVRAKGLVNSRQHLESLFEAKERGVASLQEFLRRRGDPADTAGAASAFPSAPHPPA